MDVASRRVLRLALGTALSLGFSQAVAWDLSFVAPIFTLLLLSTPMPPPGLKQGIALILALVGPVLIGSVVLLPFMTDLHIVAVFLVVLALFYNFYLTARGAPALIGTLLTMGITLNVAIGSVSPDAVAILVKGIAMGAAAGLLFVWLGHALVPDPPVAGAVSPQRQEPPRKPAEGVAQLKALRSLAVVLPVAIWLLFSAASTSYVVVMIKVASMGQQAEAEDSRSMGRSLIESTFWGGLGAVIGWQLLQIWPSLVFYMLLVAIAALVYGQRIFAGAGMRARADMWSYALMTLLIVLAPAVLDTAFGSNAGQAFWSRLVLISIAALYGSLAVAVFDAFVPRLRQSDDAQR